MATAFPYLVTITGKDVQKLYRQTPMSFGAAIMGQNIQCFHHDKECRGEPDIVVNVKNIVAIERLAPEQWQ